MEDQEKQLEADITATSRKCDSLTREVETMKNDSQVSWIQLVEKIDELERYQKGLKTLEDLKTELF